MILKIGSTGEEVKKLQSKLNLSPDGAFGPATEKSVKKWQIDNNLTSDGIVGDGTWSKMFPTITTTVTPQPSVIKEDVVIPKTSGFNLDKLKGHIPDAVIAQIPETASKFLINTPLRLAHFLAQCGHESGGFSATQENLNYSAKGLNGIFKKYFPTEAAAKSYERQPAKIASKVYGDRMGNGPESTGEGYKFRGRGYIQLTGKDNYTAFGKSINEDITSNPDKVASNYALLSAAWFFNKNGLHKMADEGATDLVVTKITKRVNGGTIGLVDRIKHFKEYYNLLK